jgi:glycosyltransferase involved in cell wall biosynthesis
MEPLISVNISCFNRANMLRECIESFQEQTFKHFEVIIVDDGSTEDLSFVKDMGAIDDRIKYYRLDKNKGMAAGLNYAARKSLGNYIMPFGSDDLALPTLLEDLYEIIRITKADMVYCDGFIRKKNGGQIRRKHPYYENNVYEKMLEIQYITHGGTLWDKKIMPSYDETVWSAEDWEFFLTAVERGARFIHIPKRLWVYRVGHPRESGTTNQNMGCEKVLNRRGYTFDLKTRRGKKCS